MTWVSSYRFGACIVEVCKAGNGSIIGEPPAQAAIVTELRMRSMDVGRRTIVAVVGASHDLDRFSCFVCATGKVKYAELATKMSKIRLLPCRFGFLIYLVWHIIGVFDINFVSHVANCVVIETKYHPINRLDYKCCWDAQNDLIFSIPIVDCGSSTITIRIPCCAWNVGIPTYSLQEELYHFMHALTFCYLYYY